MTSHPGAERFVPESRDLDEVRAAAAGCQGCDLWRQATQTVFGEGPSGAHLVLVGEQPGDHEDIEGHPSWGPRAACSTRASRSRASLGSWPISRTR